MCVSAVQEGPAQILILPLPPEASRRKQKPNPAAVRPPPRKTRNSASHSCGPPAHSPTVTCVPRSEAGVRVPPHRPEAEAQIRVGAGAQASDHSAGMWQVSQETSPRKPAMVPLPREGNQAEGHPQLLPATGHEAARPGLPWEPSPRGCPSDTPTDPAQLLPCFCPRGRHDGPGRWAGEMHQTSQPTARSCP